MRIIQLLPPLFPLLLVWPQLLRLLHLLCQLFRCLLRLRFHCGLARLHLSLHLQHGPLFTQAVLLISLSLMHKQPLSKEKREKPLLNHLILRSLPSALPFPTVDPNSSMVGSINDNRGWQQCEKSQIRGRASFKIGTAPISV